MAANTTTRRVKAKKRVDAKQQVGGLAEALREEGIDERAIAQGFATLQRKLSGSEDKGDLKLFFDVLKENHRTLEPPIASDRGSANDGPVTIILKHSVPRPVR